MFAAAQPSTTRSPSTCGRCSHRRNASSTSARWAGAAAAAATESGTSCLEAEPGRQVVAQVGALVLERGTYQFEPLDDGGELALEQGRALTSRLVVVHGGDHVCGSAEELVVLLEPRQGAERVGRCATAEAMLLEVAAESSCIARALGDVERAGVGASLEVPANGREVQEHPPYALGVGDVAAVAVRAAYPAPAALLDLFEEELPGLVHETGSHVELLGLLAFERLGGHADLLDRSLGWVGGVAAAVRRSSSTSSSASSASRTSASTSGGASQPASSCQRRRYTRSRRAPTASRAARPLGGGGTGRPRIPVKE